MCDLDKKLGKIELYSRNYKFFKTTFENQTGVCIADLNEQDKETYLKWVAERMELYKKAIENLIK